MGHFQNNGAAGGLSLRHRDYRCTGFPFLIAGDVDCFRLAVSAPFQLLAPGIVNVPGGMPTVAVQRRNHVSLEGLLLWPDTVRLLWALGGPTVL